MREKGQGQGFPLKNSYYEHFHIVRDTLSTNGGSSSRLCAGMDGIDKNVRECTQTKQLYSNNKIIIICAQAGHIVHVSSKGRQGYSPKYAGIPSSNAHSRKIRLL